jgi:hypothetical protein
VDKLAKALLALLVGILSVICAWLYYQSIGHIPLLILIIVATVGVVAYLGGRRMLPNRPVEAVYLMEGWILAPLSIAVFVGAFIIYLGVLLQPPEGAIAFIPYPGRLEIQLLQ